MTLESESSTPEPSNATYTSKTTPVIDSDDKIEATGKFLRDYYDANIDQNHTDLPMIR